MFLNEIFARSSKDPQIQMLVWEMAKAFGEECNAKDWIIHYDVCKLNNHIESSISHI